MLSKNALEIVLDPGPGFYSRLFLVEKATGGWRPMIDLSHLDEFVLQTLFKMETVAFVLLSVRDGDFLDSKIEGRVLPDTHSSFFEEAIEVSVWGDSLSVQGSVLRTVDCPSGLHEGVCSGLCLGALPRDSSSQVPGRLVGPRLFGGGGQTERPGSAFTLSLPRDCDKRGEVRSRTLADYKLPRYDHQYRGRQDFSVPCKGREISASGRDVLCYVRSPCSALVGGFGTPGFAGEAGSAQSPSNVLSAVAFEDALVSRDRPALPSGASVLGGEGESVLVDRGSLRDTCIRTHLGRGGMHTSSIGLCLGCGRRRRSCCTSIFSK